MPHTDVIVVAYHSGERLRACVEPLVGLPGVTVIVVDNDPELNDIPFVEDLPVITVAPRRNGGFAAGCNAGLAVSSAPYVLLLNPDARLDRQGLEALSTTLDSDPTIGAVGPTILDDEGRLDYSQRRFPRIASTFGQALFLHRVIPSAGWVDEVIRDGRLYVAPRDAEWLSGACLMMRRDLVVECGGLDEGFFMYCEDTDICRQFQDRGYRVRFEPGAVAFHEGGASAPRAALLPILTASRLRYLRKHATARSAFLQRIGLGVGAVTHLVAGRGGLNTRSALIRSLALLVGRAPSLAQRLGGPGPDLADRASIGTQS
jgi:N-acetylglucosaminyl-diphospho-decaprenol L-rhamnosyltransferase